MNQILLPHNRRYTSFTLWLYLGQRFFITIFLTMIALTLFVYLIDVVELLRKLAKRPETSSEVAFLLAAYKLPDMIQQLAPFSILLGTMVGFTTLTKNSEIIALRSAGLPARTFLMPALLICLAIGAFNLAVLNPLAAIMLKKYEHMHQEIFPGSVKGLVTEGGQVWLRQPEDDKDIFIYARSVHNNGRTLSDATIFVFDKEGSFSERLDADSMELKPNIWELNHVFRLGAVQDITWDESWRLQTTLTTDMIQNSFNSPKTFSVWELRKFIGLLKQTGFPSTKHEMHYERMINLPILMIAMFLLATPFALRFSRAHGLGSVILVGLTLGFGFFLFGNFIAAYGLSGRLNLQVAAWTPSVIAALVGLALFLQFREE